MVLLLLACASPSSDPGPVDARPALATYVPASYADRPVSRVVYLGDSITEGWGASAASLTYTGLVLRNDDAVWPDFADADLERYGELEPLDFSLGGSTTTTVLESQLRALSGAVADDPAGETAVVMTIGGNDVQIALFEVLAGGDDAAERVAGEIEARMDQILTALTDPALFPDGVRVFFTNVYDPTDGVGQADGCFGGLDVSYMVEPLADTNARMRELAVAHGVAMIDLHGAFLGHGMYAEDPENPSHHPDDPTTWYTADCIHPNDRGHHELRRHVIAAIAGAPFEE